jgi:RNA polymerase sigma-70 factor (ECF subfamily)
MVLAHVPSYKVREAKRHVTEQSLLDRAQNLDAEALTELYDRYAPKVYAYLYRRLSDAALAEDLTADVFVRVLQAIHSGGAWHKSFRAWLYRIAHNLVVDHYRQRPPAPPLPVDEDTVVDGQKGPASAAEDALERTRIQTAMAQLTPEQQEVLALRFGEGLKTRQAAQIMDKTAGAVEGLQRRAVASLRRILERDQHE